MRGPMFGSMMAPDDKPDPWWRRKCPKGGTHVWPRNPERDGTACLKCGAASREKEQS